MIGVRRRLYDRFATVSLNLPEAGGTIVQNARENDSNHSRAKRPSCGSKERVNGWAMPVFLRSGGSEDKTLFDHEMTIRTRDVNLACTNFLGGDHMMRLKRSNFAQNFWQIAGSGGGEVQYDKNSGLKVMRKARE